MRTPKMRLLRRCASCISLRHQIEANQSRDEEQHRLAPICRLVEREFPAVSGDEAALRVEIEENIVFPAFAAQPVAERNRLVSVCAGMT